MILKILDDVCTPSKGSILSACVDLYAREDIIIYPMKTVKVPLGVCIDTDKLNEEIKQWAINNFLPVEQTINTFLKKHYLQLEPRSSLRVKGLIAGTGIIDIDYQDEIMIILNNFNENFYTIKKGDKIAQIMMCEHKTHWFGIESEAERKGGFGSTGEGQK